MEKGRDAVAIRVFIIVDNNKGRLLLRNDHDHVYSAVFVDVDKVNWVQLVLGIERVNVEKTPVVLALIRRDVQIELQLVGGVDNQVNRAVSVYVGHKWQIYWFQIILGVPLPIHAFLVVLHQ